MRGGDGVSQPDSSVPDAATIFRGVRVLLEQNARGSPGSEKVRQVQHAVRRDMMSASLAMQHTLLKANYSERRGSIPRLAYYVIASEREA